MTGKQQVFGVFYRDYAHDVTISSANPESLLAARIPALADRLLVDADNFLGIVDRNDVILQLYLDDDGAVVLELLYPGSDRIVSSRLPRAEAMAWLEDLPAVFDEAMLP